MPPSAEGAKSGISSRAIVAKYFRIWNDGDPALVADLLASQWIDHADPDVCSPTDVSQAIAQARFRQPDTRVYIDAILGDEPLVTVNGRVSAGGRTETLVWLIRIEQGLMREMWTYGAA